LKLRTKSGISECWRGKNASSLVTPSSLKMRSVSIRGRSWRKSSRIRKESRRLNGGSKKASLNRAMNSARR